MPGAPLYTNGVDPKWFGAKADGVVDDTAAVLAAQREAMQTHRGLLFTGGRYLVWGVTIAVPIQFDPEGMLAGSAGLLAPYRAATTQQVFASDADITLSGTAPTTELWPGHFGAFGDGTDQTIALASTFRTFGSTVRTGVAHKLRLPGGIYTSSQAITMLGYHGGVIEGAGVGQTNLVFPNAAGNYGLVMNDNVGTIVRGLSVSMGGMRSTTLTDPVVPHATTIRLSGPLSGLGPGSEIVLSSAMVLHQFCGHETVKVLGVSGLDVTLETPTRGGYEAGDSVLFPSVAALRVLEDTTQPDGESNSVRIEECALGTIDEIATLYGAAIDHSAGDANNANHHFTRCILADGLEASVLLRGRNVENITFDRCQHYGAHGIRCDEGASYTLIAPQFNVAKSVQYVSGSAQQSDLSTLIGGYSEGVGQFLQVDGGIFFALSVIGFSQQGNTQCAATAAIALGAQFVTVRSTAGLYPGLAIDVWSTDGTRREVAVVRRVVSGTIVQLMGGLANAYPLDGDGVAAVLSARIIDVTSTDMHLAIQGSFLAYGARSGVMMRFIDAGRLGTVCVTGSKLVAAGFTADGVAVTRAGNLWQPTPNNVTAIVLANGAADAPLGELGLTT